MKPHKVSRREIFVLLSAVLIVLAALAPTSYAAESCGVVEKLERSVSAIRSNRPSELEVGSPVYSYDTIKTGQIGYAEIRFIDDTLMAIGPGSEVLIEEVVFGVKSKIFYASINKGSAWFATGSIGLGNPNGVKLRTPRTLVTSSNASLQFTVSSEGETIKTHWLPKGGTVSVYNVKSKERVVMNAPDMILFINRAGVMEQKAAETPEPEETKSEP
jgi:hypothetical protein